VTARRVCLILQCAKYPPYSAFGAGAGFDEERAKVRVIVIVCLGTAGGPGQKIMAKSSRRKKQDRAKVETRHADEARQRDRAEALRQADGLLDRAIDPALSPAALAALIIDGLADWTGTGFIAYTRLQPSSRIRGCSLHRVYAAAAFIAYTRLQPSSRIRGCSGAPRPAPWRRRPGCC
jgi:hypothetical protein